MRQFYKGSRARYRDDLEFLGLSSLYFFFFINLHIHLRYALRIKHDVVGGVKLLVVMATLMSQVKEGLLVARITRSLQRRVL